MTPLYPQLIELAAVLGETLDAIANNLALQTHGKGIATRKVSGVFNKERSK